MSGATASLEDFQAFLKIENLNPTIAYTLLFKNHLWFNAAEPLAGESEIRLTYSLSATLASSLSATEVNAK